MIAEESDISTFNVVAAAGTEALFQIVSSLNLNLNLNFNSSHSILAKQL